MRCRDGVTASAEDAFDCSPCDGHHYYSLKQIGSECGCSAVSTEQAAGLKGGSRNLLDRLRDFCGRPRSLYCLPGRTR